MKKAGAMARLTGGLGKAPGTPRLQDSTVRESVPRSRRDDRRGTFVINPDDGLTGDLLEAFTAGVMQMSLPLMRATADIIPGKVVASRESLEVLDMMLAVVTQGVCTRVMQELLRQVPEGTEFHLSISEGTMTLVLGLNGVHVTGVNLFSATLDTLTMRDELDGPVTGFRRGFDGMFEVLQHLNKVPAQKRAQKYIETAPDFARVVAGVVSLQHPQVVDVMVGLSVALLGAAQDHMDGGIEMPLERLLTLRARQYMQNLKDVSGVALEATVAGQPVRLSTRPRLTSGS